MANVSVIVPFFNASKTIKATLNSIRRQSYSNFECLLINDSSTDDSLKVVNNFIETDKRFKVFQQKKKGVVSARNLGIEKSNCRFITFIDSDDLWHHDFLKESLAFRSKYSYPLPITHSSYVRFCINKNKIKLLEINPPKEICEKNILNKNYLPLLTVMIDRDIVKDLKFKDIRPEDYELWINLIYIKKHKSISIKKNLAFYRVSNYQRSKNKMKSTIRMYKFFLNLPNTNFFIRSFNIIRWMFFNIFQRIYPKYIYNKNTLDYLKSALLKIK